MFKVMVWVDFKAMVWECFLDSFLVHLLLIKAIAFSVLTFYPTTLLTTISPTPLLTLNS